MKNSETVGLRPMGGSVKRGKKAEKAVRCPKCGSDNARQQFNNGKPIPYGNCFDCRNVWAFDKGPAFPGDSRPGCGWGQ